ncbi:MAG: ArsA-related P-loop ATPase [Ilumatobacter sp.]|uniref:ArsA family ATPase n=1 Tax=Ilumatobacter sp. TaxID=1967498 RepID=UPI0026375830|nr:ArsA-related P-loop ATPase [Ilumatobacter sp.]MDJ0769427.1 ArsA-related P-loop ATPase [Ilumatobacter sp.]
MTSLTEVVDGAEVVVCCGSGGVGKTTTAAVIGLEAARRGRRAVVVTIDPARRLADALGLPEGLTGEPRRVAVEELATADGTDGAGELWAMMLDTPAMFERVVRANAGDDEQADRIVQNRFYRNMATALSGTQEYMASEALHELHDDERFDLVVVDTPPSRNALDFLEAPGVLTRFLDHKAFKLLMMPTRTGFKVLSTASQPILKAIGRVVGSDVLADAVAFFQAFAGMESGFRDRADAVTKLLGDDATRFVLVASPLRETVAEAGWFADQLVSKDFEVAATVVNRMHPRFGDGSVADAARRAATAAERGDEDLAAMWQNLADLRRVALAEREQLEPLVERVGADTMIEVPLLPSDVHDLEGLDLLGEHLFEPAPA